MVTRLLHHGEGDANEWGRQRPKPDFAEDAGLAVGQLQPLEPPDGLIVVLMDFGVLVEPVAPSVERVLGSHGPGHLGHGKVVVLQGLLELELRFVQLVEELLNGVWNTCSS